MLLADRFTYIHEPKTGGSFVKHVVDRLHGGLADIPASRLRDRALALCVPAASYYPELLWARRRMPRTGSSKYGPVYNWNNHGTCSEIPAGRRSKTILATVRKLWRRTSRCFGSAGGSGRNTFRLFEAYCRSSTAAIPTSPMSRSESSSS